MRLVLAVAAAAFLSPGAELRWKQSDFSDSAGWKAWSPRSEIAPRTRIDRRHTRGGGTALLISGAGNPASTGGWKRVVPGTVPGRWYSLTAWYRAEGLTEEANQIVARLGWQNAAGRSEGRPEYAWEVIADGPWRRLTVSAPAPEKATSAVLDLWLHNAPRGTVWWDDVSLEEVPPPPPRTITVAAVRYRPSRSTGVEQNLREFRAVVEKHAPERTDLIVFPEGMTVVGTPGKYADIAEAVPGPTTKVLGELARARKSWVLGGIYERDGGVVYNTAVLVDREGRYAGKYRKVYLPREEVEAGLTAGDQFPVFKTDFGRLGMMICWDVQYADPARALAAAGADLIALPIWGGNLTLTKARAIENSVYVVTSGYDIPSLVVDPMGETVASTEANATLAVATLDLNRRYEWSYLGNMKGRFHRELRLDVPAKRPAPESLP
ncbi:MAG TPA: carbon-nitrogen hydrolase family protein [Bryobacteraceae bacterium]|nr:carbon-nitrogen hydrolase family protein [Bryobacteraceae bacterium]